MMDVWKHNTRAWLKVAVFLTFMPLLRGAEPERVAIIHDEEINESSGIAVSYVNSRSIWVHNDSGDAPRLFLVGLDGETKMVVTLLGAKAFDWEDMCSFQMDGESWLLVGDIGNNSRTRTLDSDNPCCLYLMKEPRLPRSNGRPDITWNVEAVICFDFEDGPWDCEGVAVDSRRKEILLLTKTLPTDCGLFVLPLSLANRHQRLTARRIASPFLPFVTALDISSDGRSMAIGTMLNGLVVNREEDESWERAFTRTGTPINLPPRRQGETICFDTTGKSLLLNSEGVGQPLWRIDVSVPSR